MRGRAVAPPSSCSCWRLPTGIASRATRWSRRCGPTWTSRPVPRTCARPPTTPGRRWPARRRSCSAAGRSRCSRRGRSRPMPVASRLEGRAALAGGDAAACAAAASAYGGDLLPEALYEEWTQAPRERLRSRYVELLRRSGQWERLVEVEPTDEPAYRELMRRELAAGSRARRDPLVRAAADRLATRAGDLAERRDRGHLRRVRRGVGNHRARLRGPPARAGAGHGPAAVGAGRRARRARRARPGRDWQVGALPGGGTAGTGRGLDGDRRRGHRGGRPVCAPRERGRAARSPGPGAARRRR